MSTSLTWLDTPIMKTNSDLAPHERQRAYLPMLTEQLGDISTVYGLRITRNEYPQRTLYDIEFFNARSEDIDGFLVNPKIEITSIFLQAKNNPLIYDYYRFGGSNKGLKDITEEEVITLLEQVITYANLNAFSSMRLQQSRKYSARDLSEKFKEIPVYRRHEFLERVYHSFAKSKGNAWTISLPKI